MTKDERAALLAYAAWWRGELMWMGGDAWHLIYPLLPDVTCPKWRIAESLAYDGTDGP